MYGETLFIAAAPARRGWSTMAGFTVQCAILGTALLVPMLNPEILPRVLIAGILTAPSPPPPPLAPSSAPTMAARVHRVVREWVDGQLTLPARIPQSVAILVESDLPPTPAGEGGVQGGTEGGVPNGVLNSLLNAAQRVAAPPPPPPITRAEPVSKPVSRISIGGNVQEARLIHRVIPVYPQLARQARISGEVKYSAIISREGLVQSLTLMHGHPMLVAAAVDAIRQWRYRPTILNGDPAEVVTTIIVTFTLN